LEKKNGEPEEQHEVLPPREGRSLFSKPAIHENFRCPSCHELLPFGTKRCAFCSEEIDEKTAAIGAYLNFAITQGTSHANMITSFDPAVVIFLIAALAMRFLKGEFYSEFPRVWIVFQVVVSLIWLLPLLGIFRWFMLYGRVRIVDEEFMAKRKGLQLSFRMWLAAYVVHVLFLLF
jgi:hypothetical protein